MKTLLFIAIATGLTLFTGCQANMQWFFRNLSEEEVTMTLKFETVKDNPYRLDHLPLRHQFVNCSHSIAAINYETENNLTDSLPIEKLAFNLYKIKIPKQCTVSLSYLIPTDYNYNINVVAALEQKGRVYALNTRDALKKHSPFQKTGTIFLKNLYYYDYRN